MISFNCLKIPFFLVSLLLCFFPEISEAATLKISPETGVYTVGNTFTVNVVMNTNGKSVNASDAQVVYNPKELSVVSVHRANSVFNLWTLEPTFSNSTGIISFGGGSPTGYTGSNGNIFTATFRALTAGTSKISFKNGSLLAADGLGTNVLTSMNGGTFTIEAKSNLPSPEYVPVANTPSAPKVSSLTHPDESLWYTEKTAKLSWNVPHDVVAIRTLLDRHEKTVPTIVYEERITDREVSNLDEGTSYFHIQFKNENGWGAVSHFRINVDTEIPESFTISEREVASSSPTRIFYLDVKDVSPVRTFKVQVDGGEFYEYIDSEGKHELRIDDVKPGQHTLAVEAYDSVGNKKVASYSFEVTSLNAPVFTEYPERVNTGVIPAFRGTALPDSEIFVTIHDGDREYGTYTMKSDSTGGFIFIPDKPFPVGVYDIAAKVVSIQGGESMYSLPIRFIVAESGFITIGSLVVRVLSVLIPLITLLLVFIFGTWFLWHKLHVWRKNVTREAIEAENKLRIEFDELVKRVHTMVTNLKESRKGKLTKSEIALIENIECDLRDAQSRIKKEIVDIETAVK